MIRFLRWVCVCIWKARNELIFSNKEISPAKVTEDIKSIGYLWIRNRSSCKSID
ncbi:hypothetical protein HanIR_Chr03g0139471 [Helianthus annuus]|nr:hypothetical protein HanIR_Chr03g0139471 [Helianthus annuus]